MNNFTKMQNFALITTLFSFTIGWISPQSRPDLPSNGPIETVPFLLRQFKNELLKFKKKNGFFPEKLQALQMPQDEADFFKIMESKGYRLSYELISQDFFKILATNEDGKENFYIYPERDHALFLFENRTQMENELNELLSKVKNQIATDDFGMYESFGKLRFFPCENVCPFFSWIMILGDEFVKNGSDLRYTALDNYKYVYEDGKVEYLLPVVKFLMESSDAYVAVDTWELFFYHPTPLGIPALEHALEVCKKNRREYCMSEIPKLLSELQK